MHGPFRIFQFHAWHVPHNIFCVNYAAPCTIIRVIREIRDDLLFSFTFSHRYLPVYVRNCYCTFFAYISTWITSLTQYSSQMSGIFPLENQFNLTRLSCKYYRLNIHFVNWTLRTRCKTTDNEIYTHCLLRMQKVFII